MCFCKKKKVEIISPPEIEKVENEPKFACFSREELLSFYQ